MEIVCAMAMTHSPGLTGWFKRASEEYQATALRALGEMRQRLEAAHPDVIVAFSNDHLLNWPINNTPEYTVGIGVEHVGPRGLQPLAHLAERPEGRRLVFLGRALEPAREPGRVRHRHRADDLRH